MLKAGSYMRLEICKENVYSSEATEMAVTMILSTLCVVPQRPEMFE